MPRKYVLTLHDGVNVNYFDNNSKNFDDKTTLDMMARSMLITDGVTAENIPSQQDFNRIYTNLSYELYSYPNLKLLDPQRQVNTFKSNVFIAVTNTFKKKNSTTPLSVFVSHAKHQIVYSMTEPLIEDVEDDTKPVFIVHGHDKGALYDVARTIEKFGLEVIILSEKVSQSMTIIEKLEQYSDVGYGVALYTACDFGGVKGGGQKDRARQNVVFEHGYLTSKLGRKNVSALVSEGVETPSDISGVVYIPLDQHKAWASILEKELKQAGYEINPNSF